MRKEGYERRDGAAGDKKEGEERKIQGSQTEEMERETKGDQNHNPMLNFTRSCFTKDPRAGPTS